MTPNDDRPPLGPSTVTQTEPATVSQSLNPIATLLKSLSSSHSLTSWHTTNIFVLVRSRFVIISNDERPRGFYRRNSSTDPTCFLVGCEQTTDSQSGSQKRHSLLRLSNSSSAAAAVAKQSKKKPKQSLLRRRRRDDDSFLLQYTSEYDDDAVAANKVFATLVMWMANRRRFVSTS
ncbi:unnamed protein product [Ceratitis capitata]|uniref:(Mediterranean fruit fly) hypothetical protein n=1 Tax=Ceratitis capitata TaxID=7213 RepID=A0A811U374_CERCA|nr:unnamed protein product [Ceratitis capitata]